jgi:hypothetical protein
MYRLGMCLSSCEVIEQRHPDLLSLYREAERWFEWSSAERADLLQRLSRFIFELRDTRPVKPVTEEWPAILAAWLGGTSTSDMARDSTIARFSTSPSELSVLIEDTCGYRLPWGLNSIFNYLSDIATEEGVPLPPVCSYFSGMVKYGLDDPVAVCLVPYLDQDRQLALYAAAACPPDLEHPDRAIPVAAARLGRGTRSRRAAAESGDGHSAEARPVPERGQPAPAGATDRPTLAAGVGCGLRAAPGGAEGDRGAS